MPIADLTKIGEAVWYRFNWNDDDDMVNLFTINKDTRKPSRVTKRLTKERGRVAWQSCITDGYKICRFPE